MLRRVLFVGSLLVGPIACGASDQRGADQAGYFYAELKVVPMTYFLDSPNGKVEVFSIREDGTVIAKGALVARVVGQEIQDPAGKVLIAVLPNATITGPRVPPQGHFDARNYLATEHATLCIISDLLTASGWSVHSTASYGEAAVEVQWKDGPRTRVRGHYEHFSPKANRLALLLATLLLMKPGTLDAAPTPGVASQ